MSMIGTIDPYSPKIARLQ